MATEFEIKPYPELWASLDMDVPRVNVGGQDSKMISLGAALHGTGV